MDQGKIWLRFANNEDYVSKEHDVMKCLNSYREEVEGYRVVIFLEYPKLKKEINFVCIPDNISKLEGILGKDNVKLVNEKKV